jgi:hypothetical protein
MNADAWPRVAIFAALHAYNLETEAERRERTRFRVNSMRSVGNIRLWRTYLPEACVNMMIKMGWDRTT